MADAAFLSGPRELPGRFWALYGSMGPVSPPSGVVGTMGRDSLPLPCRWMHSLKSGVKAEAGESRGLRGSGAPGEGLSRPESGCDTEGKYLGTVQVNAEVHT